MEESKLALDIAKGFRGAIQELLVPDLKAIVMLLNQHSDLLKEHSKKSDNLSHNVAKLLAYGDMDRKALDGLQGRLSTVEKDIKEILQALPRKQP